MAKKFEHIPDEDLLKEKEMQMLDQILKFYTKKESKELDLPNLLEFLCTSMAMAAIINGLMEDEENKEEYLKNFCKTIALRFLELTQKMEKEKK